MKMLTSRGDSGGGGAKYGDHRSGNYDNDTGGSSGAAPPADDLDDEIPF
jgi:hypothetical protein